MALASPGAARAAPLSQPPGRPSAAAITARRQVISGLVKFVPEDKMRGRRVVVVTNLKPAKMRDVMSYGMVGFGGGGSGGAARTVWLLLSVLCPCAGVPSCAAAAPRIKQPCRDSPWALHIV
jgi:hypothetical protein